jgi:ubiquinone/menaquinone biosynthesis C-methylase UbiE
MTILAEAMRQCPDTEAFLNQSYRSLQWGKGYFSILHRTLASHVKQLFYQTPEIQAITPELAQKLQERIDALLDQDWSDAKAGVYPVESLFDESWQDFLQFYPQVCLDLPSVWERAHHQRHAEFSEDINPQEYPDYYIQNFHHQTDGYLSEDSANLYDIQVELLFGGKADAMRRRILAPLKSGIAASFPQTSPQAIRILDVACGTGRTLSQLQAAFPQAQLCGLDLSPSYLHKAHQRWVNQPSHAPQLVAANAEETPFPAQSFHGISNVFMLHELPQVARHQVLQESYRLLQPGGFLVICDSIQIQDSPEFSPMMRNFATLFHEPFYENYVQDQLTERLQTIGFRNIKSEIHFLSQYWIAQKTT